MNLQPLDSGSQDQNVSPASIESRPTTAGVPAASIPASPVQVSDTTQMRTGSGLLHFVTPRTLVLMVVAWVIVIAFFSAMAATSRSAKQSQANVPQTVALARPLDPEAEQMFEIDRIDQLLGEFYAQFGVYPSVGQMNSEQFRRGNPSFQKIGHNTFSDPTGRSRVLATQVSKGQYFYIPTPVNCDSSKVMCTGYTVGATLVSGELYTKKNAQ